MSRKPDPRDARLAAFLRATAPVAPRPAPGLEARLVAAGAAGVRTPRAAPARDRGRWSLPLGATALAAAMAALALLTSPPAAKDDGVDGFVEDAWRTVVFEEPGDGDAWSTAVSSLE